MTTVNGKLLGAANPQRVEMRATLVDVTGKDVVGYVASVPGEVVRPVPIAPGSDGSWTVELTPNNSIQSDVGDTLWAIQEGRAKDGTPILTYVVVPAGGGPYWAGDIRADLSSTTTGGGTVVYLPGPEGPEGPVGPAGPGGPAGPPVALGAAGASDDVALRSTDPSTVNARTPTAHKASHATGGSDALTPTDIGAASQSTVSALNSYVDDTTARIAAVEQGTAWLAGVNSAGPVLVSGADLTVRDNAKGYRLRRGGGGLDLEATGADLIISNWSGTGFDGSQRSYLRLSADAQNVQIAGRVEFVDSLYGAALSTIDPAAGTQLIQTVPAAAGVTALGRYTLKLGSSFTGGENTSDSTARLELESYQKAQHRAADGTTYAHFGEVIRIRSRKHNSKQMIAWYGPTSYDVNGDPATADTAWFWMGAHFDPNDPGPAHGHWSVEVPDSNGDLQTRMELRIWDPTTGAFGMDRTILKVNAADFIVAQDNGAAYMAGAAGTAKNLYFTNDTTVVSGASATGKRWGIQTDTTAEAGSNAGSDFRINRYSDGGAFVDSVVFVKRSTGQVGIGGLTASSSPAVAAKLDVTAAGSYHTVQAAQTTTSSVAYATYSSILGTAANKILDGRVLGDTSGRLVIYTDRLELGDGAGNRDTFLRRAGAGSLSTDSAFSVGGTLTVTGTATVNGQPVGANQFAKKLLDEPVTNSATVQDDDHLTVTVAANAVYELNAMFIYDATTTGDMKAGFTAPSGSTLDWVTHSLDASAGSGITAVKMTAQTLSGTPSFGGIGTGTKAIAKVSGLLTVGSTGGTCKVVWAQNTAEASTTTMYAGSYLSLRRIS